MNRTLIATVLSVCLVSGFGISQASADELKGLISVTQEAVPSGTEALAKADELIARRGGGGGRRGGGGVRRGGGMRRGGGVRRGGGRASTARRSGGSNARRGNAGRANSHSNVRRSNGGRSSAHRSNTSHSQHASNSRSNHANHSSQKSNSKGNNKSGKNGKNSQANRGNRTNGRDGNRGGGDGGAWDGRGWDGRGWDGDAISPIDPVVPVVPVDPIYVGPRPVITLLNPAGTGASLNYTLGEAQYVIAAGETTTHDEGTQEIAFDRGSSFGEARYTLQPGTAYKFVSTDHGWDLNSVAALAGTDSSETTTAEVATTHSSGASALTLVSGN
jgi:hypothetical protein